MKINWISGQHYDHPEGFPHHSLTLWWDLKAERMCGDISQVPKHLRRRRWIPGVIRFSSGSGRIEIRIPEHDVPLRTIQYLLKHDPTLKFIKKDPSYH